MKKKLVLTALLLAAALLLCACAAIEENLNLGGGQSSPLEAIPTAQTVNGLPAGYDPASEEDDGTFDVTAAYDSYGNIVYAGATPIPIDPVDMPTPTPRPTLTFTMADYTAPNVGLTFKCAAGYVMNETGRNTIVLTEPADQVVDGTPCVITITKTAVNQGFNQVNVKEELKTFLAQLGGGYKTWQTYNAASKKMMGADGYYNNYRGVLEDGTVIRGRVHMVLLSNNTLLTVHVRCDGWYNSDYMKLYDSIHNSIKEIK